MNFWFEFFAAVIVLLFLLLKSPTAKYYIKYFFVVGYVMVAAVFLIPTFLPRPRDVYNLTRSMPILKISSIIAGMSYTIRGKEHIGKKRTCVYVANHQSGLDLLGMFEMWHIIDKMTAIAKRELLLFGTFGIGAWLAGLTFINRKSGTAAQAMNEAVAELKKKDIKIWVYPEGKRFSDGAIHPFKKGAFHAAIHAQVPIVPIVFSSYSTFLDHEERVFNSGQIVCEALPEISTEGMTADDVDRLTKETRDAMIKKFDELNQEVRQIEKSKSKELKLN